MFFHHLRNELWKLFGKKRTYIGFGAFILAQSMMLLMFRFRGREHMEKMLEGNGYLAQEYITALTVAFIMLVPQVALLMPLYATLVGGDLVAKEAEDGTLRMILSRPISRFRLLLSKWLAGIVFAIALVIVLGATAVLLARIIFPWGGMFVSFPGIVPGVMFNVLSAGVGLKLYLCSIMCMAVNASVALGFAFMFGCFNMKPAAATIVALSVLFTSFVMENIPYFENYKDWFPTFHFHNWVRIYAQPTPWPQVLGSFLVLLALNLSAFLIGAAAFQARDIKS
jgi:ABC-2 type transport system permease protein